MGWSDIPREIAEEMRRLEERPKPGILDTFDAEQYWRSRGEAAIREEMERRLRARTPKRQ